MTTLNIKDLSKEQIEDLEKQISEYKKQNDIIIVPDNIKIEIGFDDSSIIGISNGEQVLFFDGLIYSVIKSQKSDYIKAQLIKVSYKELNPGDIFVVDFDLDELENIYSYCVYLGDNKIVCWTEDDMGIEKLSNFLDDSNDYYKVVPLN